MRRSSGLVLIAVALGGCLRNPLVTAEGENGETGSDTTGGGATSDGESTEDGGTSAGDGGESSEGSSGPDTGSSTDTSRPDDGDPCLFHRVELPELRGAKGAARDFDGDGHLDLLAYGRIYKGSGPALEFTELEFPNFYGTEFMGVADVDGDGAPDALYCDRYDNELYSFRNRGDGTFDEPDVIEGFYCDDEMTVLVHDVDQDGSDDLTIGGPGFPGAGVFFSRLGGHWEVGPTFEVPYCYGWDGAWADFDQNGEPDLALLGHCSDTPPENPVLLFMQDGWAFSPLEGAFVGQDPRYIRSGDFDGDGLPDLVSDPYVSGLQIIYNQGEGTMSQPENLPAAQGSAPDVGDADADGDSDVYVTEGVGSEKGIVLVRTIDIGVFERCVISEGETAVTLADFDEDGAPDIMVEPLDPETNERHVALWTSSPPW
jgi:hypothetical protein